jgi:DNA-binding NarL/FixJ family response regulator
LPLVTAVFYNIHKGANPRLDFVFPPKLGGEAKGTRIFEPSSPGPERQQQLWKQIQAARLEYLRVSAQLHARIRNFGDRAMPPSDGMHAVTLLHRQEKATFEAYERLLSDFYKDILGKQAPGRSFRDDLTPREREVTVLVAQGKSNRQIAVELGMAFKTAVCHRARIMSKLDVHNTADLTRAAIRMGLTTP